MKKEFHKNASHFPFAAIIYFLLLILLLSKSTKAEAQDKHERILFLHPFFENHHWVLSSDSVSFNVNSTFKNHSPSNVSVTGNDTTAWFSYNHNNKVYIFKSVITYPASQFQSVTLSTDEPVELPSVQANKINTLFIPNPQSPNDIVYATSDSSTINLLLFDGASKSVTFDSTANYGIYEKIYSIFSTESNNSLNPTGPSIWVGGENGTLARLLISDIHSVTADHYNISGSETVTAIAQDLCGTASGKIFKLQSTTFSEIYSSAGNSVVFLNSNSGITENGNILLSINENWNTYANNLDSINRVHKVYRRDGSGVEILNSNWNYSIVTLSDSATNISFDNTDFSNEWSSNGSGNLLLNIATTVNVTLSDYDYNYTLPSFIMNNSDTLLKNDSIYISNSIPDREFTSDTSDLAGNSLEIGFADTAISIKLTTRKRTYNPISFKHSWTISEKNYNFNWENSSELKIILNNDSLVINNQVGQVVTAFGNNEDFSRKNIILSVENSSLILPNNIQKEYRLALYSVNGRKLLHEIITPETRTLSLKGNIGKQMLIAVLFLNNGNRIKVPVLLHK